MGKKSRRPKATKKGGNNNKKASTSKNKNSSGNDDPPSIITYTPDTSNFGQVPSPASIINFQNWFKIHHSILRELPREEALVRIEYELKEVNGGLTLKLDEAAAAATIQHHHLVVSANGVMECFNAVLSLVHLAPELGEWKFTAFSGRHSNPNDLAIQFEDGQVYEYPPNRINFAFCAEDRRDKVGIGLFFDEDCSSFGEIDEEHQEFLKLVGLMYLTNLLGEYDFEMHVGNLDFRTQKEMRGVDPQWMDHTFPIMKLVRKFDECLEENIGQRRPSKNGWSGLVDVESLLADNADWKEQRVVNYHGSPTSAAADIEHEARNTMDRYKRLVRLVSASKGDEFDPRSDMLSELGLSNDDWGSECMRTMDIEATMAATNRLSVKYEQELENQECAGVSNKNDAVHEETYEEEVARVAGENQKELQEMISSMTKAKQQLESMNDPETADPRGR